MFTIDRRRLLGAAPLFFIPGVGRAVSVEQAFPIVETAQGKVQGYVAGGINTFKGIHYGGDTGGKNRFMAPTAVKPWAGVREAIAYGPIAPQQAPNRVRDYANLIQLDAQPGGMSEDCLVLNVWTPTLNKNANKPVLVYLHGGGFYAGSGGNPRLDGEHMARFGDVVLVTVNHRLGAFGYLHLADSGGPSSHANSGAAGMLDIVAALAWIKQNIAAFGGNPNRVMVYGQSGGGAKVSMLTAMPAGKGLYHAGGIMSGSRLKAQDRDFAKGIADKYLGILGLKGNQIAELQKLPMLTLLAAQFTMEEADRARGEAPASFSPVVDGVAIPRHPFDPNASDVSADVPLIVSNTLDERSYRLGNFGLDEAGFKKFATDRSSAARGEAIAAMYRAEDAAASPYLLQARLDTDQTFSRAATQLTEAKARQGKAPVWRYLWKFPAGAFGGRYGATHAVDVAPALANPRGGLNEGNTQTIMLAHQLSSAWCAFAATGNPNNPRLPKWEPYNLTDRTTLVFDRNVTIEKDPRREFRELWASAGGASDD